MNNLFRDAIDAAKKHAREEYPKEACGIVVKGEYIPCTNIARPVEEHISDDRNCGCQLCSFEIDRAEYSEFIISGELEAIFHSHPDRPAHPSRADMECQIATDVPWIIVSISEDNVSDPVMWGDSLPIRPILGRTFIPGVTDCYSLFRDVFRLGSDKLKEQGIDGWPFPPITLPEVPRDDMWWSDGHDLYVDGMKKYGFTTVKKWEARPGDGFLLPIRSETFNHAGLLLDNGLILHHLPGRLSRREPAGIWGATASEWARYEGPFDAPAGE